MRSNDVFLGLPYDVFNFTMLQELMAVELGIELGSYIHFAASLHLYETDVGRASFIWGERDTALSEMGIMTGNPQLRLFLDFEQAVRQGADIYAQAGLDEYWNNLAIELVAFSHRRSGP
jgi:thymidylate synthase